MENIRRSTNTKVGVITVLGFAVLFGLFTWKSGMVVKIQGYEIIGEFSDVGGLLETADVRYRGYRVGRVSRIVPESKSILVYAKIKSSVKIPKDSRFRIAFDGLIGQKYIGVVPGSSKEVLSPNEVIQGIKAAGIVDFIDEGALSLIEARKLITSIRKMIEDNEIQGSLVRSATNIENTTKQLTEVIPNINKVVNNLDVAINNINDVIGEPQVKDELKQTLTNLHQSSEDLKDALQGVKKITNNDKLRENIEKTIQNLREITDDFNNGEGGDLTSSLDKARMLATMKVQPKGALLYHSETEKATGRAGVDLKIGKSRSFFLGLREDRTEGSLNKVDLISERMKDKKVSYRFGIITSELGAGVGYKINNNLKLIGEIFDPSDAKANVKAEYGINNNWEVLSSVENINSDGSDFYFGLGYKK